MGARIGWQIKDGNQRSPYIYEHWGGERIEDSIKAIQEKLRSGDISYATAGLFSVLTDGRHHFDETNGHLGFGIHPIEWCGEGIEVFYHRGDHDWEGYVLVDIDRRRFIVEHEGKVTHYPLECLRD